MCSLQWEKGAIIDSHRQFPLEGYRRLTFMMLDRDIVAVSPSSTYRLLKGAGLLDSWKPKPSFKSTGFAQPLAPHEHWHVDVSYINISGSGLEKYPHAEPRIISDNGPQFIARGFKDFIRIAGLTRVRISPYYPQSNGKIERWHKSLKNDCIRPGVPLNVQDAHRLVTGFVEHDNSVRLHSAIGYTTPVDKLAGNKEAIFAARDQKLLQAREARKTKRNQNNSRSLAATLTFSN
jgi:putative transposase